MLFAVLFEDDPARMDVRKSYAAAHVEWLRGNSLQIYVAGPLREGATETPVGGLWIVEAQSQQGARALFESDPYWRYGLRRSARIWHWRCAVMGLPIVPPD